MANTTTQGSTAVSIMRMLWKVELRFMKSTLVSFMNEVVTFSSKINFPLSPIRLYNLRTLYETPHFNCIRKQAHEDKWQNTLNEQWEEKKKKKKKERNRDKDTCTNRMLPVNPHRFLNDLKFWGVYLSRWIIFLRLLAYF